jgi:hypothetical protein
MRTNQEPGLTIIKVPELANEVMKLLQKLMDEVSLGA